jgi:hypothetical protein
LPGRLSRGKRERTLLKEETMLDGAISLASFEAQAASLPKGQEIIFYCA